MPRLPLFPLRAVLVPGLVLPLHIFEPRYRLMVSILGEAPEESRDIGIIAIRPGCAGEDDGGLYEMGTVARVADVEATDDGRFDIVTVGRSRFRIDRIDNDLPYACADVTICAEPQGSVHALPDLAAQASALLVTYRRIIASWKVIDLPEVEHMPSDPTALSYLIAAAVVVDLPVHQEMLMAGSTQERLELQCALLRREIATMTKLPSMPAVDLADVVGRRN